MASGQNITKYDDLTNNNDAHNEHDMLNARINEKADQSLDATRRILATAIETEKIGIDTNEKLVAQGQQLERINEKQDRLNEGIKKNKSQLAKLAACCDCFGFQKRRFEASQPDTYAAVKKETDERRNNAKNSPSKNSPKKADKKTAQTNNTTTNNTQYVKRILDDDREDEMEENLKQVGNIVGNLKSLALNMNTELDKQDELLDTLQVKTEANDMEVEALDIKANKMLLGKEKESKDGEGGFGGLQGKIAGGAVKNAFKM